MWGCLEEVLIPESKKRKFKLSDFTRLSLLKNNGALRFLVLKHDINNFDDNTIIESKTTKFIENVYYVDFFSYVYTTLILLIVLY